MIASPKISPAAARKLAQRDEFASLLQRALAAGRKAGLECRPQPMVVGSPKAMFGPGAEEMDYSKPVYCVDDGACGFAWVKVRPANSPFAKFLIESGIGRKAWNGGVDVWVSEFNQSVDRKESMAVAMAKVFKEAGIDAYADSRLD